MAKEQEFLDIDELPEIEAGKGIDFSEFEGKRYPIEVIEVIEYNSPYNEAGEYEEDLKRPVKGVRIASSEITTVKTKKGEDVPIRASELFNLKYDSDSEQWGISTSDNSKLRKFMKMMKVKKLSELKGKNIMVLITGDKKGNQFLGFKKE